MTSSGNDDWNYDNLKHAIHLLECWQLSSGDSLDFSACRDAIDFIEYNMREMEIIGGNGD